MKRRSFLSLLGLAPAVPLIAKEVAKAPVPAADEHMKLIKQALADTFPKEPAVRFEKYVAGAVTAGHFVVSDTGSPYAPQDWKKWERR